MGKWNFNAKKLIIVHSKMKSPYHIYEIVLIALVFMKAKYIYSIHYTEVLSLLPFSMYRSFLKS